ncbi:hypothetical protein [Ilumatobacter sp.]
MLSLVALAALGAGIAARRVSRRT